MPNQILGLDIGGANLKGVHSNLTAREFSFALWKRPDDLPAALAQFAAGFPEFDILAATMTGELCDCFATKREGVHALLDAVELAGKGKSIRVWQTDGRFVSVAEAREVPLKTAAANWLALAVFAGRLAPTGPAMLIDIGSTTADIIPILDGVPIPSGFTDIQRLRTGELVYTGVRRTPICGLLPGEVMAEVFATTSDAYLLTGDLSESADCNTADGRPSDKRHAHVRLARMIGGDAETCSSNESLQIAHRAIEAQLHLLEDSYFRVCKVLPAPPKRMILSGEGEFLARRCVSRIDLNTREVVALSEAIGPEISISACAYALTQIV